MSAGRSLFQEFTGRDLRARGFDAPIYTPMAAGEILGRNIAAYDFLLYEYFRTDTVGHLGDRTAAEVELRHYDAFLAAALEHSPDDALVILCSDHGNLEDSTVKTHTRNPVPLLAWGPGAEAFVAQVTRLDEVTPAIVSLLE